MTVIVHTPFYTNPAPQVLVQGWLVNVDNVGYLMQFIEKQLNLFEEKLAFVTNQHADDARSKNQHFEDSGSCKGINLSCGSTMTRGTMVSPEASLINMLRYGMLALALLPEHSCARKFQNYLTIAYFP